MARNFPRLAAAFLAPSLTVLAVLSAATPAGAATPAAPVRFPTAIEVLPPYQPQTFCDPHEKPGITAFKHVLTRTYRGTAIIDTVRPCASDTSEHYDGRAIDWGVDHRNAQERAQGNAFLHWLFATDSNGNRDAMVRRLGLMYVIWNHRIWGSWSQRWEPYTNCSGPTACHVDHMHLSFDWSGAMKKTSFWTGKVRAPMAAPVPALKKLHAPRTLRIDAHDGSAQPVLKLLRGATYRLFATGSYSYDGQRRHRADAECSTVDRQSWSAPAPAGSEGFTGSLDLLANGHGSWHAVAGQHGCSPTHRYRMALSLTKSAPLQLTIDDLEHWSASGRLKVTVTRVA